MWKKNKKQKQNQKSTSEEVNTLQRHKEQRGTGETYK